MTQKTFDDYIKDIQQTFDFDELFELVQQAAGVRVYFDDSRAWSLYSTEKPHDEKTPGEAAKYGAYRAYLGGGVRGAIQTNLTGGLGDLFVAALQQIEAIINEDCGPEPWEKNTGVLL